MTGVERLNEAAVQWGDAIWRASWQGAILIAIVWLIGKVWKRMPNSLRCALWIIACLRLLVGLTPLSLAIAYYPAARPVAMPLGPSRLLAVPAEFVVPKLPPVSVSTTAWLLIGWMAGVAIVGGVALLRVARAYRMAARASVCHDPELVRQTHQLRLALGLKRNPKLLLSRESSAVLTIGARNQAILLSAGIIRNCTGEEREMVIAHELCHIVRRDVWLGLVAQLAQTLFFFHPLAWLASREFDFAREAACDELAVSCLGIGSQPYGRLLLKLGTGDRSSSTLSTPGVSSHFQLLRRRIVMLETSTQGTKPPKRGRTLAIVCLASLIGIVPMSLVQAQVYQPAVTVSAPKPHHVSAPKQTVPSKAPHAVSAKPDNNSLAKVVMLAVQKNPPKVIVKSAPVIVTPQRETAQLKIFSLRFARAATTHDVLAKIYEGTDARIVADERTNSLLVSASDKNMSQISDILTRLDVPAQLPDDGRVRQQVRVFNIKYGNSPDMSQALRTLYPDCAIVSDARANSIVVRASFEIEAEIERTISALDRPKQ